MKYEPLAPYEGEEVSSLTASVNELGRRSSLFRRVYSYVIHVALFLSLFLNFVLLFGIWKPSLLNNSFKVEHSRGVSKYAGISWSTTKPIIWHTERSLGSEAEQDELWLNDNATIDHGLVALRDSYAKEMGLLPSMPFFWENGMSLYSINAYHGLHCLEAIYQAIKEYRTGLPPDQHFRPHSHIVHCLDSLRSDIICVADDTPRYLTKNGLGDGEGQQRICRDWSQLEAWMQKHDSCFKHIRRGDNSIAQIERFKYCRNDSPYLPAVRKYFGYGEDWMPWPYQEQDTYLPAENAK